ncbi:hypothetical protein CBS101457_006726 [Exobasidium rhododendri]|nr:hypothetical protein CBS101457_006726 [Exobasidium rhododendri]
MHRSTREERDHRSPSARSPVAAADTDSKMDRYFDRHYDPKLDVSAKVAQDKDGLIEDDGWDRMLQVLKEKDERKLARKEEKRRGKRSREKESGEDQAREGTGLFDTRYASRGGEREWDKGKAV